MQISNIANPYAAVSCHMGNYRGGIFIVLRTLEQGCIGYGNRACKKAPKDFAGLLDHCWGVRLIVWGGIIPSACCLKRNLLPDVGYEPQPEASVPSKCLSQCCQCNFAHHGTKP
eukprot:2280464-Amphidinium_carterae.1